MKILISGASGNFGRRAIEGLLAKMPASDLVLISRKPHQLASLKAKGCEVRFGDFDQLDSIEAAARGADKMLLISGHKVGHRIRQHGAAIDAAARAGVKHIVYTSYFGSTADNTALVCIDHHGTEQWLKSSGVAWTALRNGMYGDSMVNAAMPAALKAGEWVTCAGDGKMNMVDRDDCVDCAVSVLSGGGHENKVYDILGPGLWSFGDMAALASHVTGKPIRMVQVNEEQMYAHLDRMGIPRNALKEFNVEGFEWCGDDIVSYEREARAGKFALMSNDVRKLLNREPKSFLDFVNDHAAQLKLAAIAA